MTDQRREWLRIHRELQYLRAAGAMRRRKPSRLRHAYGKAQKRDFGWLSERWAKWRSVAK